jgi:hypothetical protein
MLLLFWKNTLLFFAANDSMAFLWSARFLEVSSDTDLHWLEGFANSTPKEKLPAHRQIFLIRQQQQANQRSAWVDYIPLV